jgi:hypothetical protein
VLEILGVLHCLNWALLRVVGQSVCRYVCSFLITYFWFANDFNLQLWKWLYSSTGWRKLEHFLSFLCRLFMRRTVQWQIIAILKHSFFHLGFKNHLLRTIVNDKCSQYFFLTCVNCFEVKYSVRFLSFPICIHYKSCFL